MNILLRPLVSAVSTNTANGYDHQSDPDDGSVVEDYVWPDYAPGYPATWEFNNGLGAYTPQITHTDPNTGSTWTFTLTSVENIEIGGVISPVSDFIVRDDYSIHGQLSGDSQVYIHQFEVTEPLNAVIDLTNLTGTLGEIYIYKVGDNTPVDASRSAFVAGDQPIEVALTPGDYAVKILQRQIRNEQHHGSDQ